MINYDKLLSLLGNDPDMVEKFLLLFKTNMPIQLERLKSAFNEKNHKEISIVAHDIKNQCGYLGLGDCVRIAENIELQADKGNHSEVQVEWLLDLEKVINRIIEEEIQK